MGVSAMKPRKRVPLAGTRRLSYQPRKSVRRFGLFLVEEAKKRKREKKPKIICTLDPNGFDPFYSIATKFSESTYIRVQITHANFGSCPPTGF
jgi:hypothetical protein